MDSTSVGLILDSSVIIAIRDIPVHPLNIETERLAGRIEGEQATQDVSIAFVDLLIGTTALQLGFGVVTNDVRHFEKIPGLRIHQR